MALDRAGKSATFRLSDHFHGVAVGKEVDLDLVTDRRFRLTGQADLLQHTRRGQSAARLFKVAAKRLGHIFQTDRLVFDEAQLNGVVTVPACSTFSLDDDTGPGLDDRDRSNGAILSKELRHSHFSTNDSAYHNDPSIHFSIEPRFISAIDSMFK